MNSKAQQEQFISLSKSKLTPKELEWVNNKTMVLNTADAKKKFGVFFSLVSRFIANQNITWEQSDLEILNLIYPGFSKTEWNKQDVVRILLMIAVNPVINKSVLKSFFEIAEMKELVALYKGLYFLENASEFSNQFKEGIRTNMGNVFDAIAMGNPYAKAYLNQDAWNQLILKSFFMDRKIYTIQNIDDGKNEHLANMLQDYVKERWAADRQVSLEIWRMISGYLREDIKTIFQDRKFEGIEKEIITKILDQNKPISSEYWDKIGHYN